MQLWKVVETFSVTVYKDNVLDSIRMIRYDMILISADDILIIQYRGGL